MDRRPTRRQFVQGAGLAGAGLLAACGPFPWQARPASKVPRIGFLSAGAERGPSEEAFVQGLREFGYVEGENITIEWRWVAGRFGGFQEPGAELARMELAVIVAPSPIAAQAVRQVTSTTPIVFATVGEPVEMGLVNSLARPGGNVTGPSTMNSHLDPKRLELLKQTVPAAARVAVLRATDPAQTGNDYRGLVAAAQVLGLELRFLDVDEEPAFEPAFEAALRWRADILMVRATTLLNRYRARLAELAASSRLPTMYAQREYVLAGGLMAYAANFPERHHRAAYYVDRILKGTRPEDLPVEQPMRFDFAVNLNTAQALGLTLPHSIMLQATEVIQ